MLVKHLYRIYTLGLGGVELGAGCGGKGRKGRKIYMYALTKPHGSCRGSSGSDMHKQIKNQNTTIKHPTA